MGFISDKFGILKVFFGEYIATSDHGFLGKTSKPKILNFIGLFKESFEEGIATNNHRFLWRTLSSTALNFQGLFEKSMIPPIVNFDRIFFLGILKTFWRGYSDYQYWIFKGLFSKDCFWIFKGSFEEDSKTKNRRRFEKFLRPPIVDFYSIFGEDF